MKGRTIRSGVLVSAGLLAFISPTQLTGQDTVDGQTGRIIGVVTNAETGQPIWSVQVYRPGSPAGALTDQDGTFSLPNVPPGTHTVAFQRIGFAEVAVPGVIVSSDSATSVTLALDPVVVVLQDLGGREPQVRMVPARDPGAMDPVLIVDGVIIQPRPAPN